MIPSLDTTIDAHAAQVAAWRRMGPERRMALALEMSNDIREVARAGIRHRHPEYDDEQVRWALYRLVLGEALFSKAYPTAPSLAP